MLLTRYSYRPYDKLKNHYNQIKTDFKKRQQQVGKSCRKTKVIFTKKTFDPCNTLQTQMVYSSIVGIGEVHHRLGGAKPPELSISLAPHILAIAYGRGGF